MRQVDRVAQAHREDYTRWNLEFDTGESGRDIDAVRGKTRFHAVLAAVSEFDAILALRAARTHQRHDGGLRKDEWLAAQQ
jgi:hypothetical protein